jgi:hypothetical protein
MERRRTARRGPAPEEPLCHVRFRTGRDASVVNVSDWGLLVEGTGRLLPGTHIDVHVVTRDGRVLVRSRVTRAWVCALSADVIQYRSALAFDRVIDTSAIGYAIPTALLDQGGASGSDYPEDARQRATATTIAR